MQTQAYSPRRHKVAYVGTYPPKECGIATFTMDMVNGTDLAGWRSIVLAVDDVRPAHPHPDRKVVYTLEKETRADYKAAARLLAEQKVSLLSIQHEYGIFGGDHGEYVLDLIKASPVPVVVTLHTVLPTPDTMQRRILQDMEKHVAGFVVMAHKATELLETAYSINPRKVHFIPHGAPYAPFNPGVAAKRKFGLQSKRVLSTFGLISPNKGIEDAIAAMPPVVEKEPNAVYLVLGQTHPVIKRKEGEWYRESLMKQVQDLGLAEHVRFVDKYLTLQQLIDYLLATDIYITPYYANPHQITSGTLAYAMATGKVIVSTPYLYAEELLADGRGFLYPFRDTRALSDIIFLLLTDPALLETTRKRAYAYGHAMTWQNVGLQYARLFASLVDSAGGTARSIADSRLLPALSEAALEGEMWAMPQASRPFV